LILDVGSGTRGYDATCRGHVNLDIGKTCNYAPNFIQGDAHHLPFKDNVFEKVFFYDIIEHVDSPIQCLREINRVLVPHGEIEVSTPNPLHWRIWLRALRGKDIVLGCYPDHIACWTDAEISNLLLRTGFTGIVFDYCILPVTVKDDPRHARFDWPAFRFGFKRVTGRSLIVHAVKKGS
jgi:ubiquinone/menaquinone biosynthesis C-methylase UbiE